jgi:transcriptional regulator with XRE-family HTH domain
MKKVEKKTAKAPVLPALARNMRELRKAKGWSQSELAERIGAHLTHVSRVETGKYTPGLDFVIKAAQALGTSVDALLFEGKDLASEIRIEDKDLAERLRLMEKLEDHERDAVITVIDSMLTKQRMRQLLEEKPVRATG